MSRIIAIRIRSCYAGVHLLLVFGGGVCSRDLKGGVGSRSVLQLGSSRVGTSHLCFHPYGRGLVGCFMYGKFHDCELLEEKIRFEAETPLMNAPMQTPILFKELSSGALLLLAVSL
ncbi:hypothetical protein HS088_TW08G00416 [Tripterygium wilfordii]|uniref:Uncharacterized protein n=1 Tax=Tripterygium wilfordii TaxID=458696 RepID=A0A7J7DC49_TRIWF|nr:hypothetical protein HS088_TW08G00416 [Tripterygium wilfordii]